MHISKIIFRNYRLLKDFSVDLEENLSLIVGKNNSGKTSLLQLLNTMLNGTEPTYNDFNLDYRKVLWEQISASEEAKVEDYKDNGISLRLFIEYGEADNLDCLGKILMDLDENIHTAVIGFDYYLGYANYVNLRKDCRERSEKKKDGIKDKTEVDEEKLLRNEFEYLLSKKLGNYFKLTRKSIEFDIANNQPNEDNYIDLKKRADFRLDDLISFGYIHKTMFIYIQIPFIRNTFNFTRPIIYRSVIGTNCSPMPNSSLRWSKPYFICFSSIPKCGSNNLVSAGMGKTYIKFNIISFNYNRVIS